MGAENSVTYSGQRLRDYLPTPDDSRRRPPGHTSVEFASAEDADRVATDVGGPWMRERILPLLARGPQRSVGEVIADSWQDPALTDLRHPDQSVRGCGLKPLIRRHGRVLAPDRPSPPRRYDLQTRQHPQTA